MLKPCSPGNSHRPVLSDIWKCGMVRWTSKARLRKSVWYMSTMVDLTVSSAARQNMNGRAILPLAREVAVQLDFKWWTDNAENRLCHLPLLHHHRQRKMLIVVAAILIRTLRLWTTDQCKFPPSQRRSQFSTGIATFYPLVGRKLAPLGKTAFINLGVSSNTSHSASADRPTTANWVEMSSSRNDSTCKTRLVVIQTPLAGWAGSPLPRKRWKWGLLWMTMRRWGIRGLWHARVQAAL